MTRTHERIATLLALGALLGAGSARAQQEPQDAQARYQEALRLEEGKGDAAGALARYQALGDEAGTPAGLRARALVRAGACLEKLERLPEALAAYQRVLGELAGVKEAAAEAEAGRARVATRLKPKPGEKREVKFAPGPDGQPRVSLKVVDADITTLLLDVARQAGLNLVVGPEVQGRVTATLEGLAPREALSALVETVGDYALVSDARGQVLRASARVWLEQRLELRAYPLERLTPGAETRRVRRALHQSVRELLARSGVQRATAVYDPASQALFVQATPAQWQGIELALGDSRRPIEVTASEGARISADVQHASVRTVMSLVASQGKHPLLIAPEVAGQISVVARDVPARVLLQAILAASGDFELSPAPAAELAQSRAAAELTLELFTWELRPSPQELWGSGGWVIPIEGVVAPRPQHPLVDVVGALLAFGGVRGAGVELDPVAHRLLVCAPAARAAELRAALEHAGYLTPAAARVPASLTTIPEGTSLRSALELANAARANLVVSPEVLGDVSGSWDAGAPLEAVAVSLARACGDYVVLRAPGGVLRVASRAVLEQTLDTRRIALRERTPASASALARHLDALTSLQSLPGTLIRHLPEGNVLLISLPPPLADAVAAAVAAHDVATVIEGTILVACVTRKVTRGREEQKVVLVPLSSEGFGPELEPRGWDSRCELHRDGTLELRFTGEPPPGVPTRLFGW